MPDEPKPEWLALAGRDEQIAQLTAQVAALTADKARLITNLDALQAQMSLLTAELLASTARVTARAQELNAQHETVQALQSQIEQYQTQINAIQLQSGQRKIMIDELQAEKEADRWGPWMPDRQALTVQLEQARRTILKLWQDYRPFVKGKLSEADIAAINASTPVPTHKE